MLNETLIVIDTETGGLKSNVHSLLTISFIVIKGDEEIDRKEWKIKHNTYHVTPEALKINGINLVEFDKEAQNKEEVGKEIIDFLSRYCSNEKKGIFVGQNTIFDKNFLEAFLESLIDLSHIETYRQIINHRYIDLMSITAFLNLAGVIDSNGLSLDNVIDTLNLVIKARHTSLDDAETTLKALRAMIKLINTAK